MEPNQEPVVNDLDPNRMEWLMNVMQHIIINPYDEMVRSLQTIKECLSECSKIARILVACLANVEQYIDVVDYAKDFEKMGGFLVVPDLLDFPSPNVRIATCTLTAELVQNNAKCQKAALICLPKLVRLLDIESDDEVRLKALYAVSCLVRQNKEAYAEFEKLGGSPIIGKILLQSSVDRLRTKASFLVSTLCEQEESFRNILTSSKFVEEACRLLPQVSGQCREYVLSTLLLLSRTSPRVGAVLLEGSSDSTLRQFVAEHTGVDQYREEVEYSKELLKIIGTSGPL